MKILEFSKEEFGSVLRELRLDAQLTQAQLGNMCNKSRVAINRYESNKNFPTFEDILDLCTALGVDEVRINTTKVK